MNTKYSKIVLSLLLMLILASSLNASIAEKTSQWLRDKGLGARLVIIVISMLPVIELRGAIPVAILYFKMPWQEAVILSVIGNMLPIPFILLFIQWVFALISKVKIGKKFSDWAIKRAEKNSEKLKRYEALGLTIFVGIPLPGTGGWTGALAAQVLGFKFFKSLFYIFIGVFIAASIVTPVTLLGHIAIN